MHITSQKKLRDFWSLRLDAEFDLRRWYLFAKNPELRQVALATLSLLERNPKMEIGPYGTSNDQLIYLSKAILKEPELEELEES